MKTWMTLLSMASTLISAHAFGAYCYDNGNGDFLLEINFSRNGMAKTAALINQNWGHWGAGPEQTLNLVARLEGTTVYQVAELTTGDLGLVFGDKLIIPNAVFEGKPSQVRIVKDEAEQVVLKDLFICN